MSGSRFYFLTGFGAQLDIGILSLAMAKAISEGFTPVIPPTMVRPEIMGGTGFLGAHAEEVYRVESDDLYLVGTSEVALAGYHADEIIDLSDGPPAMPVGRLATGGRQGRTAETPGASSVCTSSTRSRCSRTAAWRTPPRSTSGCWHGKRTCWEPWNCRTG